MPRPSTLALSLLAMLALGLAACSAGGASSAPSAAAPSEAPSEAPASAAAGGTTIGLGDSTLGQILVDAGGASLYAFTKDTDGTSTCYDECATNWPPLLADGDLAPGAGLEAALLTTVDRTDGSSQVKYGDWPLYYFAGDGPAGDTNGQGVNSVWFVVGADGALIGSDREGY